MRAASAAAADGETTTGQRVSSSRWFGDEELAAVGSGARGREQRSKSQPHQRQRHQQLGGRVEVVERSAERAAGNQVVDLAAREHRPLCRRGDLGDDVQRGLRAADDHHALARERLRRAVVARVHRGAVERAGQLRDLRIPVVAAGDHHRVEALRLLIRNGHLPATVHGSHLLHRRATDDVPLQVVLTRIDLQIIDHLAAMRELARRVGHRQARELHPLA